MKPRAAGRPAGLFVRDGWALAWLCVGGVVLLMSQLISATRPALLLRQTDKCRHVTADNIGEVIRAVLGDEPNPTGGHRAKRSKNRALPGRHLRRSP